MPQKVLEILPKFDPIPFVSSYQKDGAKLKWEERSLLEVCVNQLKGSLIRLLAWEEEKINRSPSPSHYREDSLRQMHHVLTIMRWGSTVALKHEIL